MTEKKLLNLADDLRYKYLPVFQHVLDVLNSCKTAEQLKSCLPWFTGLYDNWIGYETRMFRKRHSEWQTSRFKIMLYRCFSLFISINGETNRRVLNEIDK